MIKTTHTVNHTAMQHREMLKHKKDGEVQAGFFADAIYPTGEHVASVAFKLEYGYGVREYAFFRGAMMKFGTQIPSIIKSKTFEGMGDLNQKNFIGKTMSTAIQKAIVDEPLIDTGKMLRSPTWLVVA